MGSWLVAMGVLALAGLVAGLLVLQARQRRQVSALLARLEELEARWAAVAMPPVGPAASASTLTPSGDVLAGMTSHVARIVQSGGGTTRSLADQAIFCVYRHLTESITPNTLADELHVSLRTLERGLAVALDCTPSQLILAMKMREARRLLESGECRVAEVADRLGFANAFHFSRRFKSFYRTSPSELRQVAARR
ncbi:MAG TPA: helix-turn-helix transcriptional regulator [Thermoanaerobaculaceae bacterium]|nr:helix-turn-helix transcriptional regulator [Thermoanaerobaculaceae bacterium]HRS16832.1 helix-turn-helix transcriptional regulator [Thermoanaerobaculaceae bacterium]